MEKAEQNARCVNSLGFVGRSEAYFHAARFEGLVLLHQQAQVVIPGLANALHALSAEHAAYFVVGVHEKICCGGLFFLAAGGTCEDNVLRQSSQAVYDGASRGVIGIA